MAMSDEGGEQMTRQQMIDDIMTSPLAESHDRQGLLRMLNRHDDEFVKAVWLSLNSQEEFAVQEMLSSL